MSPGIAGQRWLGVFSIGIAVVYAVLFICFWNRTGPVDHDQSIVFHELQLWNRTLFGLAKQWTPVMCSGLSLAGEPQVPFMSLSMMLTYVLGPLAGIKIATLIYFVAGWVGAYLYAGLWLEQSGPRVLAASLFIGNGFFVCRFGLGHIDFIPFLVLPLLLWMLHKGTDWRRVAISILAMSAIVAVAIDGSPVAIIHLMFWVGLYALVLAYVERSAAPLVMFGCAVGIAALLDAGYLWPMLEAQSEFPRRTEDTFTSFLSLIWFAILPLRGKVLPANGMGWELSVFIGPVIAALIWKYRQALSASLPRSMKLPLAVVCLVSVVLGMGSLKPLHVPTWLSPFDMLRPLPGFRSLDVTGRFWGFLALPLSLLGAAALWRFVSEGEQNKNWRLWLRAAFVFQFVFQLNTILAEWLPTGAYHAVPVADQFQRGPVQVAYINREPGVFQGEVITPTRSALNCYDRDDFIHADVAPGSTVAFIGWNQMRVDAHPAALPRSRRALIELNQAFNDSWHTSDCGTLRGAKGNLVLDCPVDRVGRGPIDVTFHDEMSARGALVSVQAWKIWCVVAGGMALTWLLRRNRLGQVQGELT
jgi:hypothetical protein